jgi:hypothetical protein
MGEPTPETPRRRWPWVLAAGVVVVGAVFAVAVVRDFQATRRPLPAFASLAESPDPTLQGTIAYYDGTTGCVRIIDASGATSRDAHCFAPPPGDGPVTGPHLAWRDDGRLEVTAFSWPPEEEMTGAWQLLVDVDTGEVEEVPQDRIPDRPDPSPIPAVGPDGDELLAEVRDDRLVVELLGGDDPFPVGRPSCSSRASRSRRSCASSCCVRASNSVPTCSPRSFLGWRSVNRARRQGKVGVFHE